MDNYEKARNVLEDIVNIEYKGLASRFVANHGSVVHAHRKIEQWLGEGHGDGLSIEQCRILYLESQA